MRAQRLGTGLLACVIVCVTVACSRSDIDLDDANDAGSLGNGQSASGSSSGVTTGGGGSSSGAGSSGTTGSSASGGLMGSSASGGFMGSSASGGFVGSSASGGFVGSSGSSSGSTGPCPHSFLQDPVVSTFEKCWSCVEKGCSTALMACTQDCGCDQAIASALGCVNGGGTPFSCFAPAVTGGGDSAAASLTSCLLQAGGDCGCQVNSPGGGDPGMSASPPDASAGCVMTGGGATSGNGSCTSTIEETCGAADYQAVCACPQGRCVCFGASTTTIIEIGTCPYCPSSSLDSPSTLTPEDVISMCGFPR